jgi:hypothetical protein
LSPRAPRSTRGQATDAKKHKGFFLAKHGTLGGLIFAQILIGFIRLLNSWRFSVPSGFLEPVLEAHAEGCALW